MIKNLTFNNRVIDKGQLKKLISWAYSNYGAQRTAQMADKLKDLGFRFATRAGISISIDDLKVPQVKRQMLEAAETEIKLTEARYSRGEITEVERFQKVIDTWNSTSEALKDEVVENFKATDPLNSVYMMAFSGARGNLSQVRQLVGMRGLMADPQGEIIDLPIKTNFREGLTVTEYIISSYGARKGLVDTALRTADSGYLTRRLVDVSQDVIVREVNCGTMRGLKIRAMQDNERILIPLHDRLLGRVLAEDLMHPTTGELLATRNQDLSDPLIKEIALAQVEEVTVRSPLTCEAARSVCQLCYGWSLAHAHFVDLGEAVGIIAAQSIGEPGTQLTMRTFHTGGVFTGEVARQVRSHADGKCSFRGLRTRSVRTRHGEDREQVEMAADLIVTPTNSQEKPQTFPLTAGSLLLVEEGSVVTAGQLLAEVALTKARRSTEKAVKDVATDIAGEVFFAELMAEEKTDRQGNTTRSAVRGGLIWVLSGEVYNLPPGAEPVVKNGDQVHPGSVLAETKLVSANGGVVRLRSDREIDIITASVQLHQARVSSESMGSREHYVIYTTENQKFSLLAAPGTKVLNHATVAELIDDTYRTKTGGIIKYAGVEVQRKGKAKQGYEVVKGGTLLWIPEECHEVNKDISLLLVEDGQYVEAGMEVVKDIFCMTSGIVEVVQKNDILREMVIKPGDLHLLDDPEQGMAVNDSLVYPGLSPLPGMPAVTELRYLEYVETPEGPQLLIRPVIEFQVPDSPRVPAQDSIKESGHRKIELRTVQRIPYKDGERVKSVEGVDLLRTQLVLEMDLHQVSTQLAADIELISSPDTDSVLQPRSATMRLQLVILESLVIRRDTGGDPLSGSTETRLLVHDGDAIAPGAVVARTEIQCKESGEVRGIRQGTEAIRRILVVRSQDLVTLDISQKPTVKPRQLVVAETEIAPGVKIKESGQVLTVRTKPPTPGEPGAPTYEIAMRLARPYRVSPGAVLHIDDGDLVQRGDNLVLLVFERSKTGDIIQGLPRIEELLEARKPKEACILARRAGTVSVIYGSDEASALLSNHDATELKVIEDTGAVTEYPLGLGQNLIISDGQRVVAAEALTDGPANPHEILEIFFALYQDDLGIYEAALLGLQQAQRFLVNEVQSVYQSQGIDISDKHIEVIVRQMTSKVRIDDGGDTTMLPGELVELRQVEQVNEAMGITGGAPAQYTPVLLGITKASLNTDSFISAASFQETTRVLTEAAIEGKSDWLRGLKENVIIGRLIPAGTGYNAYEDQILAGGSLDPALDIGANGYYAETSGLPPEDPLDILDDRTARVYSLDDPSDLSELEEDDLVEPDPEFSGTHVEPLLDDDDLDDDFDDDFDDLEDDEDDE